MSKKKTFSQRIDDEADRFEEDENWGKYRRKDSKRTDSKKRKIQSARRNKRSARDAFFDN